MKILLATYWVIPHLGGVWEQMKIVKTYLEQEGHEVDILGNTPDGNGYYLVNHGKWIGKDTLLPLIREKLGGASFSFLQGDKISFDMEVDRYAMELSAAFFGLGQYDIIHAQDVIASIALSRVKPKHIPLVTSIHGSFSKEQLIVQQTENPDLTIEEGINSFPYKYYSALEYCGAHSATHVVSTNRWLQNMLIDKYAVPSQKITVIRGVFDTASFSQGSSAPPTYPSKEVGKKVIFTAARLTRIKGIHDLLSALSFLKQFRQDWVCWIAGDGAERSTLETVCAAAGLSDHVAFLGYRQDIPALLAQADLFVLPSLQDNQPVAVIEAQVAGLPVIVSDAGGLPEMVQHGTSGFVFPAGDAHSLYFTLKHLIENDGLRVQVGASARRWAETHWSVQRIMPELISLYRSLRRRMRAGRNI
ncbi:glycosyltransferase family 4 protein [Paenibacillus turpanensis]|uniref:glycosyltransferase family 4 protein n=1 Tax=Paenibacillus turpanensis TaxID=2689078 RepID=UPI0014091395|nr:glycosyltransferase family 4 protein [Paenibacillus turpanensis]